MFRFTFFTSTGSPPAPDVSLLSVGCSQFLRLSVIQSDLNISTCDLCSHRGETESVSFTSPSYLTSPESFVLNGATRPVFFSCQFFMKQTRHIKSLCNFTSTSQSDSVSSLFDSYAELTSLCRNMDFGYVCRDRNHLNSQRHREDADWCKWLQIKDIP